MAFSITGQIKVSTLKKRFHKEFVLTLRVYDGRSFADEDQSIGQIRKKKGSGDLSIKKKMKVAEKKNLELINSPKLSFSRFSVLVSQFSVLVCQFSVLSSQFSVLL